MAGVTPAGVPDWSAWTTTIVAVTITTAVTRAITRRQRGGKGLDRIMANLCKVVFK
jgi:hypothetical protein